jgi:hypothetical protein
LARAGLSRDFANAVRRRDWAGMTTMLDAIDDPTPQATAAAILAEPAAWGFRFGPLPSELVGAVVMWFAFAALALVNSVGTLLGPAPASDLLPIMRFYVPIAWGQLFVAIAGIALALALLRRQGWARLGLELLTWGVGIWQLIFAVLSANSYWHSALASTLGVRLLGAVVIGMAAIGSAAYCGVIIWLLRREAVRRGSGAKPSCR